MKNIVILTPVYNDWESFLKLINEIDKVLNNFKNINFKLIVVNDGSSQKSPQINLPKNFKSIEIINMSFNQGHAICLAHGIRYALKNYNFDNLLLMDADGEDRPEEIKDLVVKAQDVKNTSIVAKRVKRSEGMFFQVLYQIHKILTLLFTGKLMNFGNFSIITKEDAIKISNDPSLTSNYSGTLKKNIKNLGNINCTRGKRYYGPSKMPLIKLIIHSFSIMAVFKMDVFIRSALILVLLSYLQTYIGIYSSIFQVLLVFFNILIYILSLQSSQNKLQNTSANQNNVELITH